MKRSALNAFRWALVAALMAFDWIIETVTMPLAGILGPVGIVGSTKVDNPERIGSDPPDGSVWPPAATSLGGSYGADPITRPTNPSAAAMSYSLGQSAIVLYASSQSPSAVNGATAGEKSMTVTGVTGTTSLVFVNKPTTQTGLGIGSARASAANTIQVTFFNVTTATNITPTGSEVYLVIEVRGALVQSFTMAASAAAGQLTPQPTAVAANTTSLQTYAGTPNTGTQGFSHSTIANKSVAKSSAAVTMPGGLPQLVIVNKPTAQSGLALAGVRISSNNNLEFTWVNVTASPITPTASEVYLVASFRGISLKAPIIEFDVNVGTLAAINATNATEQTVASVTGLIVGDRILTFGKPTNQAGVIIGSARDVSVAGTLPIPLGAGANTATPTASEIYRCPVYKCGIGSGAQGGQQIAQVFSAAIAVAAQPANLGAEQTFANITGLVSGAPIMVNLTSPLPVGLTIANIRVSATGTLAIAFANATGTQIPAFNCTVQIMQFAVQGSAVLQGTGNGVTFPYDEQHQQLHELVAALQAQSVAVGDIAAA